MCQPKQLTLEDISSLDLPKLDPSLVSSLHRIQSPIYLSHPRNFDLYLTKEEAKDLTFKCWKKTRLAVLFKGVYIGWIDGHAYTKEAARPAFRKFFEQLLVRIRIIKGMDWAKCLDVKFEPNDETTIKTSKPRILLEREPNKNIVIAPPMKSRAAKKTNKCLYCKKDISHKRIGSKYCNRACLNKHRNNKYGEIAKSLRKGTPIDHQALKRKQAKTSRVYMKRCKACQVVFTTSFKRVAYCSDVCAVAGALDKQKRKPVKHNCLNCNKGFEGRADMLYCSTRCMRESNKKRAYLISIGVTHLKKQCIKCNSEFESPIEQHKKRQCPDCSISYKKLIIAKKCVFCSNEFLPVCKTQLCCSKKCQKQRQYQTDISRMQPKSALICQYCDSEINKVTKHGQKFCDRACAARGRNGK